MIFNTILELKYRSLGSRAPLTRGAPGPGPCGPMHKSILAPPCSQYLLEEPGGGAQVREAVLGGGSPSQGEAPQHLPLVRLQVGHEHVAVLQGPAVLKLARRRHLEVNVVPGSIRVESERERN